MKQINDWLFLKQSVYVLNSFLFFRKKVTQPLQKNSIRITESQVELIYST